MQICVDVETTFPGGLVVSCTDEYGVEYRGALLKRTSGPPQFNGPHSELADVTSYFHDHPYCHSQKRGEKARKQVPDKVLQGWNVKQLPPTSDNAIFARINSIKDSDIFKKCVTVETDLKEQAATDWPYYHGGSRSAKKSAMTRIRDLQQFYDDLSLDRKKSKSFKKLRRQPGTRKNNMKQHKKGVHVRRVPCTPPKQSALYTMCTDNITNVKSCSIHIPRSPAMPLHGLASKPRYASVSSTASPSPSASSNSEMADGSTGLDGSMPWLIRRFSIPLTKIPYP